MLLLDASQGSRQRPSLRLGLRLGVWMADGCPLSQQNLEHSLYLRDQKRCSLLEFERLGIAVQSYDVSAFYHETGIAQRIAGSQVLDNTQDSMPRGYRGYDTGPGSLDFIGLAKDAGKKNIVVIEVGLRGGVMSAPYSDRKLGG